MKKNLGLADRTIRLALAALIGILYFMNIISGTVALILVSVAAIFVLTSLIGFCPLYWPFGLNSLRKKADAHH